jgi:DNA-binding NarL/FixJ family response regulator
VKTIAIVEDDTTLLARLTATLGELGGYDVVLAAGTFAEAAAFLAKADIDVLLTDLGLPDGDGIDLIRLVYDRVPSTLIMVLTAFGEEQKVVSAILAGAKGYLLKSDRTHEIGKALDELIAGGSPISAAIARFLLVKLQVSTEKPTPKLLSERESEVLELVALGYRTREIAERLFISYHTVVNHIRNVYDKLAVSSRSQAVYKASQLGLLKRD